MVLGIRLDLERVVSLQLAKGCAWMANCQCCISNSISLTIHHIHGLKHALQAKRQLRCEKVQVVTYIWQALSFGKHNLVVLSFLWACRPRQTAGSYAVNATCNHCEDKQLAVAAVVRHKLL